MSTKTTIKRIALVAVSALGLGVLTAVAPANATATYTSSISLSTTSLTCVGGVATTSGYCYVAISATNDAGDSHALYNSETITASVIGVPTSVDATYTLAANKDDVSFVAIKRTALGNFASDAGTNGAESDTSYSITNAATESNNSEATPVANTYWLGIRPTSSAGVDVGTYTVRIRLTDSTGFISQQNLSVKFVTSPADAGATITLAKAGSLNAAASLTYTTAKYVKATLTDANGGKIQVGSAASAGPTAPSLSAAVVDADGAVLENLDNVYDTGVAAEDHVAPTTNATGAAWDAYVNGVYGVYDASIATASVGTSNSIRVRYGSTSATIAMTAYATSTAAAAATDLTLTAAGMASGEDAIQSDTSSKTWTLPLTTKTASLKLRAQTTSSAANATNVPLTVTAAWTTPYVSADVTPTNANITTYTTDSNGEILVSIENKTPLAGASLALTVSGFASSGSVTATLSWAKAAVTTVSVASPNATTKVKTGTTNTFSVAVLDQFGNGMAGEALQPSLSSTSANYSSTKKYSVITTDAKGVATWDLTDAAATAATSDAVTFKSITDSTKSASRTLSYVATLPVIATFQPFFEYQYSGSTFSDLVPSTGIYTTLTGSTKLTLSVARNMSNNLGAFSDSATDDMLSYRVTALDSAGAPVSGVPVTVTAGDGGFIVSPSTGLPVASATIVPASTTGYISFKVGATKAGAISWTLTSGSVSKTLAAWVKNTTGNARFVGLATANGDVTATVTDRYGNAVSGVSVQVGTSAGTLGNGQKTTVYTTDTNGTVVVTPQGSGDATITAIATTDGDYGSAAGYSSTTVIDSSVKAGNDTATLSVSLATLAASDSVDAANEATDAANAATDAANAAAEAADAATAAAQDAQAAVAELATQVAALIAGIKAQITTLTNLVIKIQKKVKA